MVTEAGSRRRSLRRKPLSDCTNTIVAAKAAAAPSHAGVKKHSVKSTVIEPSTPSLNVIKHRRLVSSPTKSNNSAGSNNPNDLSSLPSAPAKFLGLPRSRSGSGGSVHDETGPPAVQTRCQDARKRKDKGNRVAEDPSFWCDNDTENSGPADFQIQRQDAKTRINKGKMALGDPVVVHECDNEKSKPVHTQRQDTLKVKGKGKMVVKYPLTGPDHEPQVPCSQGEDAKRRKDKGKMVAEDAPIEQGGHNHEPIALHIQNQDEQIRKDKGKQIDGDYTHNHDGNNHENVGPTAVQLSGQEERIRKDKGKMIAHECFDDPSHLSAPSSTSLILSHASAPSYMSTPRHVLPVLSASSGTAEHQKPENLTIYTRKRDPQGRGKVRSCPPAKRIKEIRYDHSDNAAGQSGSFTDPVPVRKKKRSSNHKSSVPAMSQDEVEKLRAYYAEVDAFDLPEEVASDID